MNTNLKTPLILLVLGTAAALYAAANDLPPELDCGPLPTPAQVIARAATVTTNRFPDADTVLVDDLVREAYRPDGTSVSVDDEYTKVLTEKGRRANAVRSYSFDAAYGTVTVVRAEIVKPDGRREAIDPARNSRVMIDNGQMGANIYDPNVKNLQLSIPGLEVNDLVCLTVLRTEFKSRVPDTWGDLNLLESDCPICHFTYEVVAPAARPLCHTLLRSPISNTVTYATQPLSGGRVLHRWVARDVPQLFPEPEMPGLSTVAQRVLLSTASDWPTLSRWYWNLSKPRLDAVTPEMRTTVSNLVSGVDDRDARIRRVFTFVSQSIRYMGITTEEVAPGYEPHDVSLTFSNRYGVCRDKAALLVAMLRLAGFEAYPVLIEVGPKLDPDSPVPYFNHAIVAVARPGGGYDLMDPTNESTRDLCPAYLGNRSYLVAHPKGEPLRVSEVAPAERNLVRVASRGTLDDDGLLTLNVRLAFDGINDTAYRGHFLQQKPDERRRFFEGLLKGRFAGAELTAFHLEPVDLMDTTVPLVVTLDCRARQYPVSGEGMTLVAVPWLGPSLGYVNFLLDGASLKQRKYPYVSELACGVEESVSIALSHRAGRPLELPPAADFRRSGTDFEMTVAVTNGVLDGHFRHTLLQPEYTPAEYADLKQSLRDIEYAARERPVFAAADAGQADTRVLSDDLRIELADAHTWTSTRTTTREVLTYAGKKRNSELKMPYNPAWQTAELVAATVSNRDGTSHSIAPREINVMDAPWVGGARRYPAGKVCVVSLPGVETGSVIRTIVRRTQRDAPFFSLEQDFGGFDPVTAASLEIDAPRDLGLRVEARNADALRAVCATNGGRVVRRWQAGPLPAVVREDSLPPWYAFRPAVFISSGDWSSYARQLERAFEAAARRQPAARDQARALVKGLRDDSARLAAIRNEVARAIRNDGPAFLDLPLGCLTPADTTLADGYGNEADRAILLVAMLRAAGFDAEPVLASGAPRLAPGLFEPLHDTPQPALYDGVLVGVEQGRRTIYLNDSDQYAALGATPHDRHPFLELDGDTGRVAVAEAYRDRSSEEWTVTLEADGRATISVTNWFFGTACGSFRKQYEEMPPEERSRHFQRLVADVSQSAEAVGALVTDTRAYPGCRAYPVRADRYAVREGKTLTLLLPGAARPVLALRGDDRTNPLFVAEPFESEWLCRVILPPGVRDIPVAPESFAWPLPERLGRVATDVTRATLPDGRVCLTFRRFTKIESAILESDLYPALLEINRRLTHPAMRTVMAEME